MKKSIVLFVLIIVSLIGSSVFAQEVFSNGIDVAGTYVFGNGLITNAQNDAAVSDVAPGIGQLYGIDPDDGTNLSNSVLLTVKPKQLNQENVSNREYVIAADQIIGTGSVEVTYSDTDIVIGLKDNIQISGDVTASGDLQADTVNITDLNVGANNTISGGAIGSGAFVQGEDCEALTAYAHAEGDATTAGGYYGSHAEGYHTEVWGDKGGHAEGYRTDAHGDHGAHAEGDHTLAAGEYGAHAEGYYTEVWSDKGAHAEGYHTEVDGDYGAHAEGFHTTAAGDASHAAGSYANAEHDRTYVWSNGGINGTNIISSTISDQFTVYAKNGIRLLGGSTEIAEILPVGDLSMGIYTNRP